MPDWQPNWENVRWNHATAEAAVAALRRASREVYLVASELDYIYLHSDFYWSGPQQQEFSRDLISQLDRIKDLAFNCLAVADKIVEADARAREEQARRERERADWEREVREEEERENNGRR